MKRKFATLNKLRKEGDTAALKVKCDWVADELYILIIDGNTALRGKYSKKEIKTFCEDLGITTEDYIRECQDAFSNSDTNRKFSFAIENDMFVWRQEVDTDTTVKFGSIKLSSVPIIETLQKLLDFAFEMIECTQKEALDAKKKQQYFEEERTSLVSRLKRYEEEKTEMENILYCKFLSLLNTKKERIKILEHELLGLSSKMQHKVSERENQKSEERDETKQKIEDQPTTKKMRQSRKTNKNVHQPKTQTSTATNPEFDEMSQDLSGCSDINTTHSKGKELLIPKRNARKKGQHNIKTDSNVENSKSVCKNEELNILSDEPFTIPELKSNDLNVSVSNKPKTVNNKSTAKLEALNPSAGCSFFPSSTTSDCSNSANNDVTTTTNGCTFMNEHKKLKSVETSPSKVLTHLEKDTESVHGRSQLKSNMLCKLPDIICPIDIVSDKSSTQSCVRQNNKSKSNILDSKKKDQTSPGKQRKDSEIISPLDLLQGTAYSPPRKRSARNSEPVNSPKKNCPDSTEKPTYNQDDSASGFTKNMNIGNEAFSGNLHDIATVCEDPCDSTGITDTTGETVHGIKLIESKNEMEADHYDSDTDVDEPEDSCRSPNSSKSISNFREDSCQIITSYALKKVVHGGDRDTHQQNPIHISENLMDDSINSDNFSMELLEPALPKRTHRSDRIKKCVPVDNKSINHFTRLGQLRENIACEVQAPIYDQDTQIVDTQKLLDEL